MEAESREEAGKEVADETVENAVPETMGPVAVSPEVSLDNTLDILESSSLDPGRPEFIPGTMDFSVNDSLLDPEETFPYEDADALNFNDTWFEEESQDAESLLEEDDSDTEELRRSSRIRKPAKKTNMEKLGGTPVLREIKRLVKGAKR